MVRGEIAPKKLYEDDRVLAFHDISPQAPVHFLVIPKSHIPTTNDVTKENADVLSHLFAVIPKLAKEQGIDQDGYRLVINCNRNALQTVFHIHVHVLGGRAFLWPPG
ncbi:MAG: histidine triad nucleotide-binding protein [Candidatus Lindowbacteria bacterium RIFCSPLOWO2_12_FULL_62_27]|nr:MAG: histidine triad nucleotide-binding protein [Candidatus Lindowbacteria bacterium RIFCSPLOWO2_02_FULL_62_12]OGH59672.1 MAG: histidine triad nucleotide-binding protein [Candidatus Lindowbacteria bacterium RIFCSPLOWO2_12_FULL_62_27]